MYRAGSVKPIVGPHVFLWARFGSGHNTSRTVVPGLWGCSWSGHQLKHRSPSRCGRPRRARDCYHNFHLTECDTLGDFFETLPDAMNSDVTSKVTLLETFHQDLVKEKEVLFRCFNRAGTYFLSTWSFENFSDRDNVFAV